MPFYINRHDLTTGSHSSHILNLFFFFKNESQRSIADLKVTNIYLDTLIIKIFIIKKIGENILTSQMNKWILFPCSHNLVLCIYGSNSLDTEFPFLSSETSSSPSTSSLLFDEWIQILLYPVSSCQFEEKFLYCSTF